MIQGQDYLVFILDSQQRFYYTDEYGTVQLSATPKPIKVTPDGWQEISILKERNKKYWGMDRSFTIPLRWVEDGAKILKTLYYGQGPQAACTILILEQYLFIDGSYYDFRYKLFYKGEPDLTTFTHEGAVVTANCIEGGLSKLVKAYENTTYQIPCEEKTVDHDGINLEAASTFITTDELVSTFNGALWTWWLSINFVNNDGTVFDTEQQSVTPAINGRRRDSNTFFDNNYFNEFWFFKANANVVVTIQRKLRIQVSNFARFKYYIRNSNGTNIVLVDLVGNSSPLGQTIDVDININQQLNLNAGEQLYFLAEIQDSSPTPGFGNAIIYGDQVNVRYSSRYRTTNVQAITLNNLFSAITKKITNGVYGFQSSILPKSNVYVTCGDALRGLAEPVIKTSLSEAFDAVTLIPGVGPIGMGIVDDKLTIEPLSYWLTGDIIDLGEVAEFKVSAAADFLYNQIKVGYASTNDGDLNGKDKFHTTLEFTTESLRSPKVLSLVSPWKADPIEMEGTRINLAGKTTTDASSDNDIYLLATDGLGKLDRSLNPGAIGILDSAGMYNISLSPKRILLSWGAFIHSLLRGHDSTWIKYQTAEKNPRLVAAGIAESGDVLVGTLPDPLFIAELHDFECPVPLGYGLSANRFSYTYDGVTMTGIAFRSGLQPGKVHTFQCLGDVSNILTKQIDIDA